MSDLEFLFDLQRFAEGGEGNGDQNAGDGDGGNPAGKTFSQEELDAIVTKRLAREQKAWESKLEEEKKKASMTEQEKLKAAAEEAEKKGKTAVAAANQRLVTAEAKIQASALGANPDKISYIIKLADLSGVTVGDNGEVDIKAVKQAVEDVLKELPELKSAGAGGFNLGGNPGSKGASGGMNAFIRAASGRY